MRNGEAIAPSPFLIRYIRYPSAVTFSTVDYAIAILYLFVLRYCFLLKRCSLPET